MNHTHPRLYGLLWLLSFLAFAAAGIGLLLDRGWWWIVAAPAVVLTQTLIVLNWSRARVGTIPNLIVLCAVVLGGASKVFNDEGKAEVRSLLAGSKGAAPEVFTADRIQSLPGCVQRWLVHSNAIGREIARSARLTQRGEMRTKSDGQWMPVEAVQYVTYDRSGFIWEANVRAMPLISLVARDRYSGGRGRMLIKALALFPIADARGPEIDQGAMVRYLAEIVWAPTAAANEYIRWEPVDSLSARATMSYEGVTASGVFHFNGEGDMVSFSAKRYREADGKYSLDEWSVTTTGYKEFGGVRIPGAHDVTWKLSSGDFTWFRLEIVDVTYNIQME